MILKKELNSGNPENFKYGINCSSNIEERKMAVTLVDNHDTGASPYSVANGWGQKVWECPAEFKSRAYAFILSMPGTPCIYWPDYFDWDLSEIKNLIQARMKAGIVAGSEWIDLTNSYSGFAAIVKNDKNEEALAISILSNFVPDLNLWKLETSREGTWSVWLKK
jgi:alpha-amylase